MPPPSVWPDEDAASFVKWKLGEAVLLTGPNDVCLYTISPILTLQTLAATKLKHSTTNDAPNERARHFRRRGDGRLLEGDLSGHHWDQFDIVFIVL